jgi:hypothetical protein
MPRRIPRVIVARAVLVLAGASVLVLGAGSISGASVRGSILGIRTVASSGGVMQKSRAGEIVPRHGGTVNSANWSGYFDGASGVTAVSTTFVVPAAGTIPPGGFGATWAGIGGFSTQDLIQAGVTEDQLPTLPVIGDQYYAWYEMLPGPEMQLTNCKNDVTAAPSSCTVKPGDTVSVNIHLDPAPAAANSWTITMADPTQKWTSVTNVSYKSSESSAEWVLESPTLIALQTIVSGVGTVSFSGSTYAVHGGKAQAITSGTPTQIDMSAPLGYGLIPEATPSGIIGNGEAFDDCSYASTCATP